MREALSLVVTLERDPRCVVVTMTVQRATRPAARPTRVESGWRPPRRPGDRRHGGK